MYYGDLLFSFLSGKLQKNKTYGEGYIRVTVSDFDKWAIELDLIDTDRDRKESSFLVVTEKLYGISFVKDVRNLPGETDPLVRAHCRKSW